MGWGLFDLLFGLRLGIWRSNTEKTKNSEESSITSSNLVNKQLILLKTSHSTCYIYMMIRLVGWFGVVGDEDAEGHGWTAACFRSVQTMLRTRWSVLISLNANTDSVCFKWYDPTTPYLKRITVSLAQTTERQETARGGRNTPQHSQGQPLASAPMT